MQKNDKHLLVTLEKFLLYENYEGVGWDKHLLYRCCFVVFCCMYIAVVGTSFALFIFRCSIV